MATFDAINNALRLAGGSAFLFQDIEHFIRYARRLKPEILLHAHGNTSIPPVVLPRYLLDFLRRMLSAPDLETIVGYWMALKELVWMDGLTELSVEEAENFQKFGRMGLDTRGMDLISSRYPVVYFTRDRGARAAYTTSLLCTGCKIRYHPNYYITDGVRCYYGGVPDTIQFEKHAYIETELCELFTMCTLFAWVSGQNCAKIYNAALAQPKSGAARPDDWPDTYTFTLGTEQVWRIFFLNAILRDHAEQGSCLTLSDAGEQEPRLQAAMEARTTRMIEVGQPHKMHACTVCERFIPSHSGEGHLGLRSLRAVVTDGVSIGHPCCGMHNCTKPLVNNCHHFCEDHIEEASVCAIVACNEPVRPGHRTCTQPDHISLEMYREARGKAFFQLQQRLKRNGVSHAVHSDIAQLPDNVDDDEELDVSLGLLTSNDPTLKSDAGNRKLKARFGRRRTHNEQLIVCCCGVIAARATMFGAEAISGVKDFYKSVYRAHPLDIPEVGFYDNNCGFQEHVQKQKDAFFEAAGMILPVDVFHFKSKHKETDEFCQKHCNPAMFPELHDEKGHWHFNSSAAEQANVWIDGYLPIVREMLAYRFEFFLDEMIKRRNEILIAKLRADGQAPYIVPSYATTLSCNSTA
ncbi:hypothetical protein OF83DRAFT_1157459 [Amylostereum chailletii]|nr:hypothetical protein OF83DRAFT_1157459 [Amylostereum chailletii]